MPILLDKLVSDIMAIVVSVTVLLFVGEIVPQALCTGPNQMKIAAFLAPFTYGLMIITFPLSYPIAKFMDLVVGKHSKTRFCNSDLKSVIELHLKEYKGHAINTQQIGYFTGFLDLINTKVKELTIPMEKVYKLDYNQIINYNSIKQIKETGYSRIPIYEDDPNNLIGILYLKDLVGNDLTHPAKLNELNINILNVIHISEETFIFDLLEQFQNGNSKMAFVYKEISKDDPLLLPDDRITVKEDNKGIDEQKEEEKIDGKESLSINDNQFEEELLSNNINKTNKVEENLSEDKTQEKIIKEDKLILDKDSLKKTNREIIGIITLKDLIESLLKIHFHNENEIIRKSIRKSSI
jgi:metal transporter CNNM